MKDDTASPVRRLRALPRPRPATAIALLALMIAMGGTSIAGSVINGSDLKDGSVTRPKIGSNAIDATRLAGNAVTSGKIAKAAVGSSKLAKGAVTAAALAPGSVTGKALGAAAVAGSNLAPAAVSWKSIGAQVVAAPAVTLPGATTVAFFPTTATATCPAGLVAISGGESFSDITNAFVIQSVQVGAVGTAPTGWTATGAAGGLAAQTMTVYAICISAGS